MSGPAVLPSYAPTVLDGQREHGRTPLEGYSEFVFSSLLVYNEFEDSGPSVWVSAMIKALRR